MPLAILEESSFDERMRRLPSSVAILGKALTYIGSLLAVFLSLAWVEHATLDDMLELEPVVGLKEGCLMELDLTIVGL